MQNVGLSGNAPQPLGRFAEGGSAFRLRGPGHSRAKMLDRRLARHAGVPLRRRRPHWSVFDTGTTLPLRAMAFADDQHGWAAGELGTILATSDGGRTWQSQRAGGCRPGCWP